MIRIITIIIIIITTRRRRERRVDRCLYPLSTRPRGAQTSHRLLRRQGGLCPPFSQERAEQSLRPHGSHAAAAEVRTSSADPSGFPIRNVRSAMYPASRLNSKRLHRAVSRPDNGDNSVVVVVVVAVVLAGRSLLSIFLFDKNLSRPIQSDSDRHYDPRERGDRRQVHAAA